jgi:hypothetical protein
MASRKHEPEPTFIQRLWAQRKLADQGIAPTDPDFEAKYPFLWQLLTDPHVSEDEVTDCAYVRFSNNAGDWSFSVISPGMGGSAEVLVRTVQEGLQALETALAGNLQAFRFWKGSKTKVRKNGNGEKTVADDAKNP